MALDPCGTVAAYTRHRRNNETPCEPCRLAKNAYNREYRSKPKPEKRAPTIYPNCKECGRPRMPKNGNSKDFPGHVRYATKELCNACWTRAKRRKAGVKPQFRRPDNCVHCGRDLYTYKAEPKPHPDAVPHAAKGACNACYKAGGPTKPQAPRPTECVDCGVPLRPQARTEAEFPGTKPHTARGLCRRCYYPRVEAPRANPEPIKPVVDPVLEAFNRQRRERIARTERAKQLRKRLAA